MARRSEGVLGLLLLLAPGSVIAQQTAVRWPGEGSRVRVASNGTRVAGTVVPGAADSLSLVTAAGDTVVLARSAIDSLWTGRPATGKGARTGAIAGAAAGGVGMGLSAAVLVESLCETDDCEAVKAGLVGGGIGAAGGALAGALIGALVGGVSTDWRLDYPGHETGPATGQRDNPVIEAFALYGKPLRLEGGGGAGIGIRGRWRVSPHVSLGPEMSVAYLGEGLRPGVRFLSFPPSAPGEAVYRERTRDAVVGTHVSVRIAARRGKASPYLVAGGGVNWYRILLLEQTLCEPCGADLLSYPRAESLAFPAPGGSPSWSVGLGYSAGLGVEMGILSIEGRWHGNPDFFSAGAAVRFGG